MQNFFSTEVIMAGGVEESKRGSRGWVFTINNYTKEDIEMVKSLLPSTDPVYLVAGFETCPTTGTPHIQGAVRWKDAKTMSAVKRLLPRAHLGVKKGSDLSNDIYCTKEDNILIRMGKIPKQGKRKDLDTVKEMVKTGKSLEEITDFAPSYQAVQMAKAMLEYHEKKRDWVPEVTWIWGETGLGKTEYAKRICREGGRRWWISGKSSRWWIGYDAHEDIIIDEMRDDWCTFHELLRILDSTPYTVETKGGARQLLARRIYITSCHPPHSVYKTTENVQQLIRRITTIIHVVTPQSTEVEGNTGPRLITL